MKKFNDDVLGDDAKHAPVLPGNKKPVGSLPVDKVILPNQAPVVKPNKTDADVNNEAEKRRLGFAQSFAALLTNAGSLLGDRMKSEEGADRRIRRATLGV